MKKTYLTVIILLFALGGGILVWHDMRDAREEAAKKSAEQESSLKETGQGQGLVWYQVPELGIEFQIKKEAADELVYTYESYPKNVPFGSAFFTAKGLDPGCKMGGVMIVHRFEGVPENYDANMMMGGELKQFDGFFIKFYGPQCASDESFINWTERVRGENQQVDVWITGILETMRKTSQQPAMNKKSAGEKRDFVWYQIPELGIEFQIEKLGADELIYIYGSHPGVEFGGASFSTKKLSQIPGCEAASGPLGALTKLQGKPNDYKNPEYLMARSPRQFDGFFLIWSGPQAVCARPEYKEQFDAFFEEHTGAGLGSPEMLESIRETN